MKLRQSVSAAALVAAALLLLTGCFPPGLLPQRPEAAPMPESTFAPDEWVDDEDVGDDWVDDEDIVPDGVVDESDLYSWVSSSEGNPWVVSVDVDMNAFAMVQEENLYLFLIGDAAMSGKSIVLNLSTSTILTGPGSPVDDYVLTIDNVEGKNATMTVVKNGVAQPTVGLSSIIDG